jgi:CRISPR type I-D-associated protein Csc2
VSLNLVEPYLIPAPAPLVGAETIQIIVLREVLDYTVLRTEETRELNTVYTPLSVDDGSPTKRVAFLGTKQKAPESRELEYLLRTANRAAGRTEPDCYLKDNLCLRCPRCGLFGATAATSGSQERANIKHRIEYSTAFSLLPFEDIADEITFNAINDDTQMTGQALGSRHVVRPATLFPSIVTLKSVTRYELVLTVKTLLACKSYGAESRTQGECRNTIVGIVAGWEEVLTPLELTLELYDPDGGDPSGKVAPLVNEKYKPLAANRDRVTVLSVDQVEALVSECSTENLDKAFLDIAYRHVGEYRGKQGVR